MGIGAQYSEARVRMCRLAIHTGADFKGSTPALSSQSSAAVPSESIPPPDIAVVGQRDVGKITLAFKVAIAL